MPPTAINLAPSVDAKSTGSPPVEAILKLEALGVLVASLVVYYRLESSWWLFATLILAPDLSAIGYARGAKVGAWCYDLAHTYVIPAILGAVGYLIHEPLLIALAAIWFSHIGIDRLIGYGLKFGCDPKDTHMSRLSRKTA